MFGVPGGSILGPLVFNIFLADLFLIPSDIDIANFADDNTPYLSAKNVEHVVESLKRASVSLFRWFEHNLLKGNADKYHFLVRTSQEVSLNVNTFKIKNSDCEELLGVKFDSKLKFDQHITDLCRRASRKICAIARMTPFMNLSKRSLLMNSFLKTQFNYCPLIWMCHSRENYRKIKRLHERCLKTTYNDKQSSFNELLEKDGSASIHERNRFSGKVTWKKKSLKLLKANWKFYSKFDISKFGSTYFCACVFFCVVKQCVGFVNTSRPIPGRWRKIKLNFYFHTSLWSLKKFYEGLKGTTKKCENKKLTEFLLQYNLQKCTGR